MDASIVCVNWNSVDYLRECLASIYETTRGVAFEIIVVDNASPAGDVTILQHEFPEITIVKSTRNLGFAGANNLGFRQSVGDHVLFLNPDTRLITPAISTMLQHLRSLPDAGIVGCKLLNSDLSIQTQSIQKFPTILNQLLDIEYLRLRCPNVKLWAIGPLFAEPVGPIKVEVIPGACQFLKREVFEAAGLYSEDYFMYAEDIDLNYKVAALGLGSYYIGEAVIIHHGGTSSRHQKLSQWSTKMKFRAMVTLYRKWHGRLYSTAYRAAMAASAVCRLAVLALVFPFKTVKQSRDMVRVTAAKWLAVLKCAVGLGAWV
ncbi:MAG: glycosyltransferase family 2 protein [Bryobacteraceae bacterium]